LNIYREIEKLFQTDCAHNILTPAQSLELLEGYVFDKNLEKIETIYTYDFVLNEAVISHDVIVNICNNKLIDLVEIQKEKMLLDVEKSKVDIKDKIMELEKYERYIANMGLESQFFQTLLYAREEYESQFKNEEL
jgi:hypothetical protein